MANKLESLEARELANYAGSHWHVLNSQKPVIAMVAAAVPNEEEVNDLAATLAALPASEKVKSCSLNTRVHVHGRDGCGVIGGGKAGLQAANKRPFACLRHCTFGEATCHCDYLVNCSWSGSRAAGGH